MEGFSNWIKKVIGFNEKDLTKGKNDSVTNQQKEEKNSIEHRKFFRVNCNYRLKYYVGKDVNTVLSGEITNLSANGAAISTMVKHQNGEFLHLNILLGIGMDFENIPSKVIRVINNSSLDEWLYTIAVSFEDLSELDKQDLIHLLNTIKREERNYS